MTTTAVTPTLAQIRQNVMEDARTYQDERIEELTDANGAMYSRTFAHAAMISHWATMFHEPVSTMIVNFSATPSIAIPAIRNLPMPAILTTPEPELEYPPLEIDNWETTPVDNTPALPVPPPQHHIHPAVVEHLNTLHVTTPAPPIHTLGSNREPITPTDPVPSMPSSPPQFLQVDPQDLAPPFEQIVNALIQRDVEMTAERIAREEREEGQTPSPTGPQPNVHPGPGWKANFEDEGVRYAFQIPAGDGRHEIAPFVMIDWNSTSPELLGTQGRSCLVYAKHLHARSDEHPRPAFDRRQEFFFVEHQTHSDGVDWAMQQEGDDTLRAEVIRHRAARTKVIRRACQVAEMREQLADDRFALLQTTRYLARANAYHRLRRHITHDLTPATSTLNARHISRIQEAVDSPWNWTDEKLSDECLWCKCEGHKIENCVLIRVCELCHARGHLEENCFQPHSHCVSFQVCCVPLLHKYRSRHACPSVIILERT